MKVPHKWIEITKKKKNLHFEILIRYNIPKCSLSPITLFFLSNPALMYASIFGNVSAIIQRLYSNCQVPYADAASKGVHSSPNPPTLWGSGWRIFQHAWTYTNGIDMNMVCTTVFQNWSPSGIIATAKMNKTVSPALNPLLLFSFLGCLFSPLEIVFHSQLMVLAWCYI